MDNGHHKRLRTMAEPLYHDHPNDPEALWMMSFVNSLRNQPVGTTSSPKRGSEPRPKFKPLR
jgi:hypothetical protein